MKNLFKIFGIIALVAVIGLLMTTCGGSGGGGGKTEWEKMLDELSTATPSGSVLTAAGIDATKFDNIKNSIGGYKGWTSGSIIMIWTGRSASDFSTIKAKVKSELSASDSEYTVDGINVAKGKYDSNKMYFVHYYPKDNTEEGLTVPAGTIDVIIGMNWID